MISVNLGFALDHHRRAHGGPRSNRVRARPRARHRKHRRCSPRPDEPARLDRDVRRRPGARQRAGRAARRCRCCRRQSWVTHDRATLGVLFYRGCEWLASSDPHAPERARSLFKTTTEAYRATGNRDVLPVALGLWAQAEQRSGNGRGRPGARRRSRDADRARRAEPAQREPGLRRAPRLLPRGGRSTSRHRGHPTRARAR